MRELKIKNTTWISLVKPSSEDIEEIAGKYPSIHPLVLESLKTPTIRPTVENYDHHLYMVLHFPALVIKPSAPATTIKFLGFKSTEGGAEKMVSNEIDFILMKDTLITVQYEDIPTVEGFLHECEEKSVAERYGKTPVHLTYYLMRQLFAASLRELDQIQTKIDEVEEEAFEGREKKMLEEVALLKQKVLDFRRAVKPQQFTLESLLSQGTNFYGESVKPFLTDLVGEYLKVWNLLENHKETLDALYDTTNSLLAAKTNEVMRAFTILAFISFIPTAIANIYGMNIDDIPLAERPDAFFAILALMGGLTVLVYLALKWRKLV